MGVSRSHLVVLVLDCVWLQFLHSPDVYLILAMWLILPLSLYFHEITVYRYTISDVYTYDHVFNYFFKWRDFIGSFAPAIAMIRMYLFNCVATTEYVVILMEKDPVCKMNVDKPKATETFKGKTYHFCSNACKSTFDRNRDMFIDKE